MTHAHMSSIALRASAPEDRTFVDDLTRFVMFPYVSQTWRDHSEREAYFFQNRFDLPTTKIITYAGKDAGRLSVAYGEDRISINNIHLLPEYQGKGVGRYVIEQIFKEADARAVPVTLTVLEVNPSKRLYEKLGFHVRKMQHNRYHMERLPVSTKFTCPSQIIV